jgi:hypothetical protein
MRIQILLLAVWLAATMSLNANAAVDSDGDGLCDFQEVHKYFTDPIEADSDGDGTTQVELRLRDGETQKVLIALGQSGFEVYKLCKSAKIYADDDPWLIAMSAGEGMYAFFFLAEGTPEEIRGQLDPRRDKLYAVIRYPTNTRDNGEFLIPKKMDGRDCGDFVTLRVSLSSDKARAATVTLGMTTKDVMRLFRPAQDHEESNDLILLDAIHNNGRYLLRFSTQADKDTDTPRADRLSQVMYWPGGQQKSIFLLPREKRGKTVPANCRSILERGTGN